MKTLFQYLLFPVALCLNGEFTAESGSAWFYFLCWVYGEENIYPICDAWYPEDQDS